MNICIKIQDSNLNKTMHDASCNLKKIQLHNATITYEGIEPFKLLIVTQVSYKRFNENNTYMIQATLQSQLPSHKKYQSLQSTKVGCDSSRIQFLKNPVIMG
jgi:hypothetical protein